MAQLHGIHRGIDTLRPTSDVDMVLHVETTRGVAAETARALEDLGYEFMPSIDDRNSTAHRFQRGGAAVDLVTSAPDVVDVLIADHAAPKVVEKLHGKTMVAIEGGTQALKRTVNARIEIMPGPITTVCVPSPFDAVILKAAAYQTDSRAPGVGQRGDHRPCLAADSVLWPSKERHLQDAALPLSAIDDPRTDREQIAGSDRSRLSRRRRS
ncbi:MAG: hypothetical protein FWE61_03270 [Micrococcales bacterium]|nr:hypothetical protein [Micrococcales bacterium]